MKYFSVRDTAKVYIYAGAIHMSRSFRGLSQLIKDELKKSPESGDLYLFMNKNRSYIKTLFFAKGGHCIFAKKLAVGHFALDIDRVKSLDTKQLHEILDNVNLKPLKIAA